MWFSVILLTTRCSDCVIQYPLGELAGNTYCNLDLHPELLGNNFLFAGSSNSRRGQMVQDGSLNQLQEDV